MPICKFCKKIKPVSDFYVVKGYKRKECKKCANRLRHESRLKKRRELKIKAVQCLGGKCQRCRYNKYIGALEFHHFQKEGKEKEIHDLLDKPNWEKIRKELKKCILVCANCHREIHSQNKII